MSVRRTTVIALALAAPLLSLTACSGSSDGFSQPDVSAFRAGDCRTAAPNVLTIGREARKLGTAAQPPAAVLAALTDAQAPFLTSPFSDAQAGAALRRLTTAVGFVRLRSVGKEYDPSLAASVTTAYDDVLRACTGSAPKS